MNVENDILSYLSTRKNGASISDTALKTSHTRATTGKYLELLKIKGKVDYRSVGKAKIWYISDNVKKILLATKKESIHNILKATLGTSRYAFIDLSTSDDVFELVHVHTPDLIILDYAICDDPFQITSILKKNALTREIPILLLSEHHDVQDKAEAITSNCDDLLFIPFDTRDLRNHVLALFAKFGTEKNPITNLPYLSTLLTTIKTTKEKIELFKLTLQNIDIYKRAYGLAKTYEVIRVTAELVGHILERHGDLDFIAHLEDHSFAVGMKPYEVKEISDEIENEFENIVIFFYGKDMNKVSEKKLLKLSSVKTTLSDLKKIQSTHQSL